MSKQKLKILRTIKGADSYSKNPMIDSIIRQKLKSEIIVAKDNFNQLIRRDDPLHKEQSQQTLLLRKQRLLTPKFTTITTEKIKESLNFNPVVSREVVNFVVDRQRSSPLLSQREVDELNRIRTNNDDFYVKMNMNDKNHYQQKILNWAQDQQRNMESKVKSMLPNELWIPAQPEVQQAINTLKQNQDSGLQKFQNSWFKLYLTERSASSSKFTPLKGSRLKMSSSMESLVNQITYEPKKYHKDDYAALQKWLQSAVQFINITKKQAGSSEGDAASARFHLNSIYAVYMCCLKEMIRLTYIESTEKGLLLEKIIWSLLRLLQGIIEEQHRINFAEFKLYGKEMAEMRSYYQSRIEHLQKRLAATQSQIFDFELVKRSLALSCLSYKRVNAQMSSQIRNMMMQTEKIKKQGQFLMSNLLKLVTDFQERGIIKIRKSQDYNEYFYVNSSDKAQIVAKVPRQELLQKYFQQQVKAASRNVSIEMLQDGVESQVEKLDSQLTSYWQKKQNFLQINRIIQDNFKGGSADYGCQVDTGGPNPYYDEQTQFPEQNQESFQQFLKRQLQSERQQWTKKEGEYKQYNISLKQLYQEAYQTISILNSQNFDQKQIIEHRNQEIGLLNKAQQQLQQKIKNQSENINSLQKDIHEMQLTESKLKAEIDSYISKIGEQKKKYFYENQNNKILATNNFNLKQKVDQLNQKLQNLQDRVRMVAPYLQKIMGVAESSQNEVLLELTSAVDKHLSEFVAHDGRIFLTR